ncbi:ornithine cyclodeaminase [Nannochloropsis oceanica]
MSAAVRRLALLQPRTRLSPLAATTSSTAVRAMATMPTPKFFDYATVKKTLNVGQAFKAVEEAFAMLADGKVDVPQPMHIGIHETPTAGPGDCHIKGGYIEGKTTFTVKLATVSFYKNMAKGLPPGAGIFVVCDATNGAPVGVFQENRFMTDLRTGAAGGIAVKYFGSSPKHTSVGFVGTGAIAKVMAQGAAVAHKFKQGYAYGLDPAMSASFAKEIEAELGYPVKVCATAEEAVRASDVLFTQTPGSKPVLELSWLKPHATIIASGSDQPTKNEIPPEVQAKSKFICDLVRQCSRLGELRTGIASGLVKESDVHAEIGEVVSGKKKGREGDELILVDLTGTGAQDAAIGQVAWDILSKK